MKIYAITPFKINQTNFTGKKANTPNNPPEKNDYNPTVYKDQNTGRLFRTPEDFYSQPFNRNGMPDTMKKYLEKDYEKHQHIPPMQVMQIVFSKLDSAKNLDAAKAFYPNEKLFNNLSSSPKVKTGVISDIEYVKKYAPDIPLFKDGKDDLGIYLLKKIYLEGKTLHEIDKDFQKDINNEYKGIEHIKDETIYSFGIRRPKVGFWQSLVHNRENFPYVYIPRSKNEQPTPTSTVVTPTKTISKPAKPRRKLSDGEKRAISEYMLDLWSEMPESERERRKKKIKLGQENSFLFKYTQPIMTLAAAQINLSGKLSDYLSNARIPQNLEKILLDSKEDGLVLDFDSPSGKQKAIMKNFWKENNSTKTEFGAAIRSILDEFQQAYGEDGENEEFKILIQIADDIRNENAQRLAYRRQRKADVEAAFKDYKDPFAPVENIEVQQEDNAALKKFKEENEILDMLLAENKAQKYVVHTPDGDYNFVADFKKEIKTSVENRLRHYPRGYVNTYTNFLDKCALMSDQFMVATLLESQGRNDLADMVLPKEERDKVSSMINKEFILRNENSQNAAIQVVTDFLSACRPEGERAKIYFAEPIELTKALNADFMENVDYYSPDNIRVMNNMYAYYKKPLTFSEINKITNTLISYIRNLDTSTLVYKSGEKATLLETMSANIQHNDKYKEIIQRTMRNDKFIENYGGSLRTLFSEHISQEEKNAKCEKVIYDFLDYDSRVLLYLATSNKDTLENIIRKKSPTLYAKLQSKMNYAL